MSSQRKNVQSRRKKLHEQMRALSFESLMRGSIVQLRRRCGKTNCACATDPKARHSSAYLSVHLEGRTQTLYLRPEDEERVRKAIAAYEKLWAVIDGLTACEFSDLKRQARERRRSRKRRRE